jgi:hypothetical protein
MFLKQVTYVAQNWPILHVVASDDGTYLAVAGHHGLVLYDLRNKKWRFFGDVTQEQQIQCKGLLWLGSKMIVVCNYIESSNTSVFLLQPFLHLLITVRKGTVADLMLIEWNHQRNMAFSLSLPVLCFPVFNRYVVLNAGIFINLVIRNWWPI